MILTEDGYRYSCTTCPKTGQPCVVGLRMARQLGRALNAGEQAIDDDFELTGHGRAEGLCGQSCGVVYSVYKGGFRVFCGVSEDADPDQLRQFADGFLSNGPIGSGPFPKAMVLGQQAVQ